MVLLAVGIASSQPDLLPVYQLHRSITVMEATHPFNSLVVALLVFQGSLPSLDDHLFSLIPELCQRRRSTVRRSVDQNAFLRSHFSTETGRGGLEQVQDLGRGAMKKGWCGKSRFRERRRGGCFVAEPRLRRAGRTVNSKYGL